MLTKLFKRVRFRIVVIVWIIIKYLLSTLPSLPLWIAKSDFYVDRATLLRVEANVYITDLKYFVLLILGVHEEHILREV